MASKIATWDRTLFLAAMREAFLKLTPRTQIRNPVLFATYIGGLTTTFLWIYALWQHTTDRLGFNIAISVWLWLTLFFANFAESLAEGRSKAQANALRKTRNALFAKLLTDPKHTAKYNLIPATQLKAGDIILVETGDTIPSDGTVIEGIASVNEGAITGESAPVIRESGGDRNTVTGGTQLISDWLIVEINRNPGETFIDQMISLIESAKRQKTPNELGLTILLSGLTLIFLGACAVLIPYSIYSVQSAGTGQVVSLTVIIATFVCLAPTTIGALLSAIGIAGIDRLIQANIITLSGRAIEAAGDITVLLLDKTGTVTLGNRQATEFIPAPGVSLETLVDAAQLATFADETPEGRSIMSLAKTNYGLRGRDLSDLKPTFIPFTAHTRMSGANLGERQIRKGATDAITEFVTQLGGTMPPETTQAIEKIARLGGTPLVVAENARVLGVIQLKDIVKGGIRERFAQLRQMGIKTIMVTGDNPLTAAAIAAEAGVDDFLANAKPQDKLNLIRRLQSAGQLVAMTGDGTNDAPALAQADVAVAMNTGTQAAKEAGNFVDLDSNPTKIIEVVEIGKQLLMTRGALTTFSIANDVAKYFTMLPAAFVATYPALAVLNIMHLTTAKSAILSTVIFNALIIICLIPLALRGVKYQRVSAARLLRRHVLIYGLGGMIVPFIGIKLIDLLLFYLGLT